MLSPILVVSITLQTTKHSWINAKMKPISILFIIFHNLLLFVTERLCFAYFSPAINKN